MKSKRHIFCFATLALLCLVLFVLDMTTGTVAVTLSQVSQALFGGDCPEPLRRIVIDIRLLKAVSALMVGASLSVSGLQMQTLFRNPLAGPYVLGVSSGASLGVAILMLGLPMLGASLSPTVGALGVAGAAFVGAASVLVAVTVVARKVRDIMVVLILGMMFSSAVGAVVQILQYVADEQALKSYVVWTMGSLGNVTRLQLIIMLVAVSLGLLLAVAAIKPLNLLQLGEEYAMTMGLDLRRARMILFASTALLAGSVTAFCGPIGFIGLAMPHVTRMIFGTGDNRTLVPGTVLSGAVIMLLCDIISKSFTLPINAVTALAGIPIVVWVVLRNK